jgi:hypothetical protein
MAFADVHRIFKCAWNLQICTECVDAHRMFKSELIRERRPLSRPSKHGAIQCREKVPRQTDHEGRRSRRIATSVIVNEAPEASERKLRNKSSESSSSITNSHLTIWQDMNLDLSLECVAHMIVSAGMSDDLAQSQLHKQSFDECCRYHVQSEFSESKLNEARKRPCSVDWVSVLG